MAIQNKASLALALALLGACGGDIEDSPAAGAAGATVPQGGASTGGAGGSGAGGAGVGGVGGVGGQGGAAGQGGASGSGAGGVEQAGQGGEAGQGGAGQGAGSGGEAGGAGKAGAPPGPVPVHAFRKVAVGDVDIKGSASSAWQRVGMDIDGVTSSAADTKGHCKPRAGGSKSSIQQDGDNGIDNSFARNVLPIFQALISFSVSDQANASIEKGDLGILLRLDDLGPGPDQGVVPSSVFVVGAQGGSPTEEEWQKGTFAWDPAPDFLATLDPPTSSLLFPLASLKANRWTSNGTVDMPLSLPIYPPISITLPLHAVRFEMKLSDDHKSATSGQMGGVLETKVFVEIMHSLVGLYGQFSGQDFCNSAVWDGLKSQIEQASDVMLDGTQDETKECDGISFGISFETAPALLGEPGVGLKPPLEGCPM